MPRLTADIAIQQQNPINIGLPPVLTSLTIFVFIPMAAIAITIKNLLSSLIGSVIVAGSENTVVTTAASRKKSINIGNALFKLNVFSPLFSFLAVHIANTKVIGMIASVLVSFTIVAVSRVFAPGCIPSHALAAAVTDEVSLVDLS